MAESKTSPAKKKRSTAFWPFRIAIFLSFGWLGLAIFLGYNAGEGKTIFPFDKLTANEWGDFIAGVAGALAFIWIIATVFIQSKELSLQRDELSLQRDEIVENRGVMAEQAAFIGEQTRLLKQETRQRQQQLRLDAIKSIEAQIERMITQGNFLGFEIIVKTRMMNTEFGRVDLGNISHFTSRLYTLTKMEDIEGFAYGWQFGSEDLSELIQSLAKITRLTKKLYPEFSSMRTMEVEIRRLILIVCFMFDHDENLVKRLNKDYQIFDDVDVLLAYAAEHA